MKKKYIIIIGILIVLLLAIATFFISDHKMDLEDKTITQLYKYLGEVDIYHCSGLNNYTGNTVTINSLDKNTKLCMAYYNLENEQKTTKTTKVTKTNAYDTKICEFNNVTLAAIDEAKTCSYEEVSLINLKKAYQKIYGEKPEEYEDFYISSHEICTKEKEGETYYCGEATSYNINIMLETDIYRLKSKAVKTFGEDIIIYDYFLKVSDNKCYLSNNNEEESSKCTSALAKLKGGLESLNDEAKTKFVIDYGALYKHTFKKDKNNNYYWFQSEKK